MAQKMNPAVAYRSIEYLMINLRSLMRARNINEAQLARETNVPQPTLHKILSGKTIDPRTSTLKSLADYFGISIDDLLSGNFMVQATSGKNKTQSIAIISWADCIDAAKFMKKLTPALWDNWIVVEFSSQYAFALTSKPSMEPRFPRGTILIIDPGISAEDGDLVVVSYPNTSEATLRELSMDGPSKLLLPICGKITPTNLDQDLKVLGVVVKSIFSYH